MFRRSALALARLALTLAPFSHAQGPDADVLPDSGEAGASPQTSGGVFIDNWLSMVTATQAEQPHWSTPVVMVTPRLEQEYRL
jgi:hypothetical protein